MVDPLLVLRAKYTKDLARQTLTGHARLFRLCNFGLYGIEELFDFIHGLLVRRLSTRALLCDLGGWSTIRSAQRPEVLVFADSDALRFDHHLLADRSFSIK